MPLHRALPQQVRFIHAESAGSYVYRLASANGLEFAELLDRIGRGRKALPALGSAELYLNTTALSRLSVLSGRDRELLQWALPAARSEHLLPSVRTYPAWRWLPQESGRQYLVRACRLCAAARGVLQTVHVWSDMPWQVCLRHKTWQDAQHGRDSWAQSAEAMAWILPAHRRRLVFEQRLGQMGRPLFADAYMTLMTWKQQGWMLPRWLERLQSLQGGGDSISAMLPSVVMYPEAVELAQLFGQYERQRITGTLKEHEWWWQLARTVVQWDAPSGWPVRTGTDTDEAREPIDAWIAHHNPSGRPLRKLYKFSFSHPHRWTQLHRHRRLRLREPHESADRLMPLERVSCFSLPGATASASTSQARRTGVSPADSSASAEPRAAAVRQPGTVPQGVGKRPSGQSNAGRAATSPARLSNGTVRIVSESPRAMNLRFRDPEQLAAIAAAARREGVSMQEYILSAAYARATAVEQRFLKAFEESMDRSGAAFASETSRTDHHRVQRAAEQLARRGLETS